MNIDKNRKFNFENTKSRKYTGSSKWEDMYNKVDDVESIGDDILPISLADMEFESDPLIYQSLVEWLSTRPILGYACPTQEYFDAVIKWKKERHNMDIKREWIVNTPGVVSALRVAVNAFSEEGEGVIIFKPVYNPFHEIIKGSRRKEVNVSLLETPDGYRIDFEKFEEEARKKENKILILCNPHNPVGRTWTKEELLKINDIVCKNDLVLVSDEIWNDIINPEFEHFSIFKLKCKMCDRCIVCTALSKTFNLAGLTISNILIKNKKIRNKFIEVAKEMGLKHANIIGVEATKIAYNHSCKWLDEVIKVIYDNQKTVKEFFEKNFPLVKAPISEATYLQWVDFRALGLSKEELEKLMIRAKVFTTEGYIFGDEGIGFERFNVALPKEKLKILLHNLLIELRKLDIDTVEEL